MYGIIYKTTNLVNGKIYIGQHVCESDEFDGYLGSGRNLLLAVRHYGPENFKRETLRICDTQPQLDAWEMLYIKKLHSTEKDIGYNILPGSSNMFGQVNPAKIPEVKCKMSIAAKRRLSSPAAREAIRIRMTGIKQSGRVKSQEVPISYRENYHCRTPRKDIESVKRKEKDSRAHKQSCRGVAR